jgi:hypothetical protein
VIVDGRILTPAFRPTERGGQCPPYGIVGTARFERLPVVEIAARAGPLR